MAPRPIPSKLNRALMNLFVGMCRGVAGLPRHFRVLEYLDKWIELGFENSAGDLVVPELIVSSRREHHSILFEWKSGQNADEDQLRRYAHVTGADLRDRAHLSPDETASHNIVLVGFSEAADRLAVGMDNNNYPFVLLLVADAGLEPVRNRFTPEDTDRAFRPYLAIDWDTVPSYFFPVDVDSELWEFAEVLVPRIFELMGRGEPRIMLAQLEDAIPCWNVLARNYQGRLRDKIHAVMRQACQNQFEQYIRPNRDHGARNRLGVHWDIINNPVARVSDGRNAEWRRLATKQRAFLELLRNHGNLPEQGILDLLQPN
jgi:hypothetical protein